MRKRNTENIGDILKEYFEQNPFIKKKLAENRVLMGWDKILGNTVASYTDNLFFKNNILYVHLTSSVLRVELISCKERIISNLNKFADFPIVKDIIFR